ncbi:hypothetical protein ONZ45_g11416 [Pleurotus djamor]|nr:hypothetical protein ONZ45_g11416 [Pleurotus djamor]
MSLSEIKLTVGALQVAVIITGYLLGCSAVQTYIYFKNFQKDLRRIHHLVSTLMILETAQQVCLIHTVYVLSIENWGKDDVMEHVPGSLTAAVVLHVLDAYFVENFYFWRIFKLTGKRWPSMVASFLSLVRLAGWLAFAVKGAQLGFSSQALTEHWMWLIVTLLFGIFLSNGFISSAILLFFYNNRVNALKSTKQMLDQLITWTIETCLITELFYAAAIILFLTVKNSFVWLVVLACGVKGTFHFTQIATKATEMEFSVSSNCLLSSLNNRPLAAETSALITLGQDVPLDTHLMILTGPVYYSHKITNTTRILQVSRKQLVSSGTQASGRVVKYELKYPTPV